MTEMEARDGGPPQVADSRARRRRVFRPGRPVPSRPCPQPTCGPGGGELQVHQIELEMQNAELRRAPAEARESEAKFLRGFQRALRVSGLGMRRGAASCRTPPPANTGVTAPENASRTRLFPRTWPPCGRTTCRAYAGEVVEGDVEYLHDGEPRRSPQRRRTFSCGGPGPRHPGVQHRHHRGSGPRRPCGRARPGTGRCSSNPPIPSSFSTPRCSAPWISTTRPAGGWAIRGRNSPGSGSAISMLHRVRPRSAASQPSGDRRRPRRLPKRSTGPGTAPCWTSRSGWPFAWVEKILFRLFWRDITAQ